MIIEYNSHSLTMLSVATFELAKARIFNEDSYTDIIYTDCIQNTLNQLHYELKLHTPNRTLIRGSWSYIHENWDYIYQSLSLKHVETINYSYDETLIANNSNSEILIENKEHFDIDDFNLIINCDGCEWIIFNDMQYRFLNLPKTIFIFNNEKEYRNFMDDKYLSEFNGKNIIISKYSTKIKNL